MNALYCRFSAIVLTVFLMATATESAQAQMLSIPQNAWRGKIRAVDGIFRDTYHAHWGNGVTDNGLALGTNAINGFVAVAPALMSAFGNTSGVPNNNGSPDALGDGSFVDPPVDLDPQSDVRAELIKGIADRQKSLLTTLKVSKKKIKELNARHKELVDAREASPNGLPGPTGGESPEDLLEGGILGPVKTH